MNWLTNFVRPKLRQLVGGQKEIPENLWHKCPGCGQMLFHRDLEKNLKVCHHCGHHIRIGAAERLGLLLDPGFETIPLPETPVDPLKFRDRKRYGERLKEAQASTGAQDALTIARGAVDGVPALCAVLDFAFMGGSMGLAVGEGFVAAAERAIRDRLPLVAVSASGGARMQEGILSLMQLPRTIAAVQMVHEAGLPYVVILTDPTTGGVSASFAMLGDVTLAEPGAVIGFAGQRVIEQTIREKLPEGFQRSEYLQDHGMVDRVVHRAEMKATLATILRHLTQAKPGLRKAAKTAEAV